MTDLDKLREELNRIPDSDAVMLDKIEVFALLDRLEKAEAERDEWKRLLNGVQRAERAEAELASRIEDRDYWYRIATEAKDQRDRAEAAVARVRSLIAEWQHVGALGGPFPDRVVVDVDCEVIDPLLAALDSKEGK